jgi:GNAT superfamily N-acetyltransferase
MYGMRVRPGRREESALLSELALRSKSHWGYDADFLDACREELRLQDGDLDRLVVRVAEHDDGRIAGFYAIAEVDGTGAEILFFFVDLPFIGRGIGRRLFDDLIEVAREAGLRTLRIDADPGAAAFYERMGAEPTGQVPSGSIPGRFLPSYRIRVP